MPGFKAKCFFLLLCVTNSLPAFGFSLDRRSISRFSEKIKNWGLMSTKAPKAWEKQTGSRDVVVAIIDTGIDPTHPDLSSNIWHDPKEKNIGWNFVSNQGNPIDEHGHGTHVAGIIGSVINPEHGTSGVVQEVSLMPIKYYSDKNSGLVNLSNTVKAIHYAIEHGARIINYSGGGPDPSPEEEQAIREAEVAGILFVAAAGNEHQNTDQKENYYFPAAYSHQPKNPLSNIISVAAIDIHDNLLPSSNWGKNSVDVAAPGDSILSTLPQRRYGKMSGTSQATAFVTGIAALLLAQDPSLTPQEIKRIILKSVDPVEKLQGQLISGGKVNTYSALLSLKTGFTLQRHISLMNWVDPLDR
jgi:thermitase